MKHGRTALWIILICLMLIGLPMAFADNAGNYTDAEAAQWPLVTVNGSTGPVTVSDGASFHVHIAFENDVYVQPLKIMAGNQEIPYWEWSVVNEWMNNGAVDFDYSLKEEQSTVILYAQTGVDNPATGETEWTTTSNKVTVNAVSQAGTLSPASFIIENPTVTQGEYLRVTVNAVDQNTKYTSANVENLDHTIYRGEYSSAVDSNTILVPTVSLEPGTYTLNVDCSASGYRMSRATAVFDVTAPETPVEIGLTAARNEILTNQSVLISGYAPGAAYLDVSFYDDPNGETASDTRYGYDGYIDAYYSWPHEGIKLVKLNAYYHDQDTVSTTLSISVNTSNGGSTPNPTITVPATLAFGSDLEVNYSASGAERLRFKLFSGSYGNSYCVFDRTIQLGDNKSGIFRFDASLFESSGPYSVIVESLTLGENSGYADAAFTVTAGQDGEITEEFTVEKNEIQTMEPLQIVASVSDADTISIEIRKAGDSSLADFLSTGGKTLSQDWRIGSSGSYTLTAYAYRSTPDANGRYEKEHPGSYKRMIGTENVTVTAPNGSLAAPVLTGIPSVLYSGSGINGTVQLDGRAEQYRLYVNNESAYDDSLPDIDEPVSQTLIPLVIDAESLQPGSYRLQIYSEALGYEETLLERRILVEDIEEADRQSIILTADGRTSDIGQYPVNTDIQFSAAAPRVNNQAPTDVRFFRDDALLYWQTWEHGERDEHEQTVFHWNTSLGSGTHTLYAQASYDGGVTWPMDSNVITVNMVSRGQTQRLSLSLQQASVAEGVPINVTVSLPDDAASVVPTEVDLQIVYPDGLDPFINGCGNAHFSGIAEEDFPLTVQVPTDGVGVGTYVIRAYASAEWYERSSSLSSETFTVEQAYTSGTLDGISWEIVDHNLLNISGIGAIPDFDAATDAPWYPFAACITRARMESGISGIGKYAFACFGSEHPFRVEFNQAVLPSIDDNAFSGTTAICRYYINDASYAQAGQYDGTLEWIYLPVDNQENTAGSLYYHSVGNPTGWAIWFDDDYVPVTLLQAKELTYSARGIVFYEIPTSEEDLSIFEDRLDPFSGYSLTFVQECEGEFTLELSESSRLSSIDMDAPGLKLTINDPRQEDGFGRLLVSKGTVIFNGNIMDAYLWDGSPSSSSAHSSVTISGNVENLNFYGSASDNAYTGDLTVNGTIIQGVEYGDGTIAIPGISDNVEVQNLMINTLVDINQSEPVVLNGHLNVPGAVSVDDLDISMFQLTYHLRDIGWHLALYPRGMIGSYNAWIDNVLEYNPNFSANDILWGEDTKLYVYNPGDYDHIILNGGTDSEGRPIGLGYLFADNCDITVNCPVDWLIVEHHYPSPSSIKINAPVELLGLNNVSGDSVELGEGGSVQDGQWDRAFMSRRDFGPVTGPCPIYQNDQLCVLNWKSGEMTQVIMPSEGTLTAAAGLNEGQIAQMDVSDAYISGLSVQEQEALESYLADTGLDLGDVASVFDVSINSFSVDANGEYTPNGVITELNEAVNLSVRNTAEGEGQVVRLHENNDGTVTAMAVSASTAGDEINFTSDLFSKYAIVPSVKPVWNKPVYTWAADNSSVTARRTSRVTPGMEETETAAVTYELVSSPTQTSQGTVRLTSAAFQNPAFKVQSKEVRIPALGNMQVLSLPGNLSSIEEEAFMGGAFEAVIVPAGCTNIGNRAFSDCTNLIFIRIPGDSTTVSDTAFEGCGMVIIDRTPLS